MKATLRVVQKELPHARDIARAKVAQYRASKPLGLTQQDIDGDGTGEGRLAIAMANSVRFKRRSFVARLLGWLR